MRKKLIMVFALVFSLLVLTGCWAGEIGVETNFDGRDGSGTRTFVLDVMDDTLSQTPIGNPDDPEGTEGKGAVINSTHIDGGVEAIQTWLVANAPTILTVEPMRTDGYHRYFTLTMEFEDFADFLAKYQTLVDLSPLMSWADFSAAEKPTWTCDGGNCTFTESKALLEASLDWAIDGIWNDIYVTADLEGLVTKPDISVLANYTLTIGEEEYEELQHFDAAAVDGDGTGAMVYVTSETFTLAGDLPMSGLVLGLIIGGALVVAGGAFVLVLLLTKKKVA